MELPLKKVLTFEYLVIQVKKRNWREFLKMNTRLELNPAKIHQLQPNQELKIMEISTSWKLKGMEKGMK